jgi:soluble P-type ATPase
MDRAGILIEIPGFGTRDIHTVVCDFTGTLSCGGRVAPGVRKRLLTLLDRVELRIITSDSFGRATDELKGVVAPRILSGGRHDIEKQDYVKGFALPHVAALGNGNNDRLLLKTVKEGGGLAVAVDNGEGCAIDALLNAHLLVVGAANALDLLLEMRGCMATLRF